MQLAICYISHLHFDFTKVLCSSVKPSLKVWAFQGLPFGDWLAVCWPSLVFKGCLNHELSKGLKSTFFKIPVFFFYSIFYLYYITAHELEPHITKLHRDYKYYIQSA